MAILCKKNKLLYIMIGGTGCTSVGKALIQNFKGEFLPKEPIFNNIMGRPLEQKHNTLRQLIEFGLISDSEAKNYLKFGNVRNPFDVYATVYARYCGPDIEKGIKDPNSWVYLDESGCKRPAAEVEKAVSHFKNMIHIARHQGFDAWLNKTIGSKTRFKGWIKHKFLGADPPEFKSSYRALDDLDDFIRFEYLEEDFNRILKKVGVEQYISLPNVNPTSGKKSYKEYYSPKSKALIESVFRDELDRFGYSF